MSATVSRALSLLSAVETLVAGAAVTLGGVGLTGLEVPAHMPWGGEQRLVVHKLPGGGRVVDALGRDDRDIEWSGTFTGSNAVARAQQLDALRVAGVAVTLTWASFRRTVVVKSFDCDYGSGGSLLPYRVVCVVVTVGPTTSTPTLLSSVTSDITNALGLSGLTAAASSALKTVQAALPVAAVLTKGSAAYLAVSSGLSTASSAVGAANSAAETTIGTAAENATAAGTTFASLSDLQTAAAAQDQLSASAQASALVGRASANMAA